MLPLIHLDPSTPLAFSDPSTSALAFSDPWIRTEVRCHSQCAPKSAQWIREGGCACVELWITESISFSNSETAALMLTDPPICAALAPRKHRSALTWIHWFHRLGSIDPSSPCHPSPSRLHRSMLILHAAPHPLGSKHTPCLLGSIHIRPSLLGSMDPH